MYCNHKYQFELQWKQASLLTWQSYVTIIKDVVEKKENFSKFSVGEWKIILGGEASS